MTFKKMMQRDVKKVFLNVKEYADLINIDGVIYQCIVMEDEFTHEMAVSKQLDGVFMQNTHILIDTLDIKTPPVDGQRVVLKNKPYYVANVQNEYGILNITLGANQS